MNPILDLLSQKQTLAIRNEIITYVFENPRSIKELMDCFFSNNLRINQYASWPLSIIGEKKPALVLPYLKKMIKGLDNPVHNAVVRNTVRILQTIDIPEELEGIVYDICFKYLTDNETAIAIRAFSMTVLSNMAMKYPELKEELIKTIEMHYPYGSRGFQSRAKKEIKRLSTH